MFCDNNIMILGRLRILDKLIRHFRYRNTVKEVTLFNDVLENTKTLSYTLNGFQNFWIRYEIQ